AIGQAGAPSRLQLHVIAAARNMAASRLVKEDRANFQRKFREVLRSERQASLIEERTTRRRPALPDSRCVGFRSPALPNPQARSSERSRWEAWLRWVSVVRGRGRNCASRDS